MLTTYSPAAFLLLAINPSAFADDSAAISSWLQQRALSAAEAESPTLASAVGKRGSHRILHLEALDAPEEVKDALRRQYGSKEGTVERVPDGTLLPQSQLLALLPRKRHSEAVLRQRLPTPPSNVTSTILGDAELIGMEPSGALDGIRSSGLARYYMLPGLGIVEFNENNYVDGGMHIEVIAEALNTRVRGVPARLQMSADSAGRSRVELSWVLATKAYSLIAWNEGKDDLQDSGRTLEDIAQAISD